MSSPSAAPSTRPTEGLPSFKPLDQPRPTHTSRSTYTSVSRFGRAEGRHSRSASRENRPRVSPRRDGELDRSNDNAITQARNGRDKTRKRSSGNFLLHPFSSINMKRRSGDGSATHEKNNGAELGSPMNGDAIEGASSTSRTPKYEQEDYEAELDGHMDGTPFAPSGLGNGKGKGRLTPSAESSNSSHPPRSPSSAQKSMSSGGMYHERLSNNVRHSSADVDPSQVVRMALSLNESRRLGLAPGQLASGGSVTSRRAASAGLSFSSSPTSNRQRPASSAMSPQDAEAQSRNPSTSLQLPKGTQSRAGSSSPSASRVSSAQSPLDFDSHMTYDVSPATMLRAEKARAYFELAHEYRRVLDVLPPLKPRGKGQSPHPLGRQYNPLQYIRNRRLRARERQNLDGAGGGWNQVQAVDTWVNVVEVQSKDPSFYEGDLAFLPPYQASDKLHVPDFAPAISESQSKQNRYEWELDPADLLAELYWLEQDDHKTWIEDRLGDKVFTEFTRPTKSRRLKARSRAFTNESLQSPRNELHEGVATNTDPGQDSQSEVSESSDGDQGLQMHSSNRGEVPKKNKRKLFRRRKTIPRNEQKDTDSDDRSLTDRTEQLRRGPLSGPNFGPLEKHMNMILEKEKARSNSVESETSLQPRTGNNNRGQLRRGGVSDEYNDPFSGRRDSARDDGSFAEESQKSPRSSVSSSRPQTPRISVDDFDRGQMNGHATSPTTSNTRKRRAFPLGFIHRRGKSKLQNNIAENDFAMDSTRDVDTNSKTGAFDFRHSLDSPRSTAASSKTNSYTDLTAEADERRRSEPDLVLAESQQAPKGFTTRLFKGGRIGELVRNEASPKAEVVWKAPSPRQDSAVPGKGNAPISLLPPKDHRRSRSTNDLTTGQYHIANLPSFKSSHAPDTKSGDSDHIARQQQAMRSQRPRRKSRFDRLGPISTGSTPDVSPGTSQVDLSRQTTTSSSDPNKFSNTASSRSSTFATDEAGARLNRVLREPGALSHPGLPVSGLSAIDPKQRSRSRDHREWNLGSDPGAIDGAETRRPSAIPVTARDIAYVKALLLSSGIKASAIVRRANEPHDEPSQFLVRASGMANVPVERTSRREEHVVAARLLSGQLSKTVSAFEDDADRFRNKTCNELQSRIDDLRDRVSSQITPEVRTTGDDADAFIAKLTTEHTLAVTQVNNKVEEMMRSRWRRLRWLRRTGFTMLEWLLVAIMWAIWVVVLGIKVIRAVIGGLIGLMRWLLWLS